jgi:hypothetical protein
MSTLTTRTTGPSSQTTTPSPSVSAPSSGGSLPTGAVIGIAVGVSISVLIFVLAIFLHLLKRGWHIKHPGTLDDKGHSRATTDMDQVELKPELPGQSHLSHTLGEQDRPNSPSHASQTVGPFQDNNAAERSVDSASLHSTESTEIGGVLV